MSRGNRKRCGTCKSGHDVCAGKLYMHVEARRCLFFSFTAIYVTKIHTFRQICFVLQTSIVRCCKRLFDRSKTNWLNSLSFAMFTARSTLIAHSEYQIFLMSMFCVRLCLSFETYIANLNLTAKLTISWTTGKCPEQIMNSFPPCCRVFDCPRKDVPVLRKCCGLSCFKQKTLRV